MSSITLTINHPSAKPVTTTINTRSGNRITQKALDVIAKVVHAVSSLPPDEIETLADQLQSHSMTPKYSKAELDFAANLGVDKISDKERSRLELDALNKYFKWRQELLKCSITASEVAQQLNIKSRQTPHDRLKNNSLVAVQDNGVWKFPIWQFDPKGPNGVIDGLPEVLKALDVPDISKINWLTRPNKALNELSPVEALKQGYCKKQVIAEARSVGVL